MNSKQLNKGFSVVEVLIVALIVGLLAFIGYWVYDQRQDEGTVQSPTATDVSEAPAVTDSADLDEASRVLDANDPAAASNDAAQLDSELSNF